MQNKESKELILGCAFNYHNSNILPFLNSLQLTGYTGDLILLTNNQSLIDLQQYSFNGKTINVDTAFKCSKPTIFIYKALKKLKLSKPVSSHFFRKTIEQLKSGQNLSISVVSFFYSFYFLMTSRFFLYYYYLFQSSYDAILLTDVNDVFFQADPFDTTYNTGVTAFSENELLTIGQESTNRFWILEAFGSSVLEKMDKENVFCAGTILVKDSMKEFLKDFLQVIVTKNVSSHIKGIDQGVYNYMVSYLKLPYFNRRANGDVVLTLASLPEESVAINRGGISYLKAENQPHIIHQFNRFPKLMKYATERFSKVN